jgi:hypothetical protein
LGRRVGGVCRGIEPEKWARREKVDRDSREVRDDRWWVELKRKTFFDTRRQVP